MFGQRQDHETVDVEADETVFAHWTMEEDGVPTRHFWWVWLGIQMRGVPESLWLKDMGVRASKADKDGKASPPQLTSDEWLSALNEAGFCRETRAVLFTDGAPAFVATAHPGVVDKAHVNHSQLEMVRSCEVLKNTDTRETRAAMASTQMIDRIWGLMKSDIEKRGISPATERGRALLVQRIRAAQFRRMCGTGDLWVRYCEEVVTMREQGEAVDHGTKRRKAETRGHELPENMVLSAVAPWVEEGACPLAEQCGHHSSTGEQCPHEVHGCCPRCLVALCADHLDMSNVGTASRCHEHAGEATSWVSAFCPCSDCRKVAVIQD